MADETAMAMTGQDEGSLQRMAVGDISHQRWRRNVAEKMEQENIYRDGSGANVRADGVHQRGVERRSIQQEQKRRHGDGGHHRWPLVNRATIITGTPRPMLTAETK